MNANLTSPVPVRLTEDSLTILSEIEAYTGTDKSKLLRLAIRLGLPEVQRRFGSPSSKRPAKKA